MKKRDHLDFLCTVGELGAILAGSADVIGVLHRLVELVAKHMQADVCSVYLYDNVARELVMRATFGLKQELENSVRLIEGEGLVGLAMRELRPILENHASANPNYRFVDGLGEERFESFLAVPITRGVEKVGVITAQREERNHFAPDDVMALRAVAAQVAGTIESARLLMDVKSSKAAEDAGVVSEVVAEQIVRGMPAAEGYAYGLTSVQGGKKDALGHGRLFPHAGLAEFRDAAERTEQQISALQTTLGETLPEAAALIFEAQILMLKDESFVGAMEERIKEGTSAGAAIADVAEGFASFFRGSAHTYMQEKEKDVLDVSRRLLDNLAESAGMGGSAEKHAILVARELYPSEVVMATIEGLKGIVLVGGGVTTHVSILARAMELPLIITEEHSLLDLPEGTHLLLDGATGNIYINPLKDVVEQFEETARQRQGLLPNVEMRDVTLTQDGTRVHLMANINLLSELEMARDLKAEGVGLYRTEFPFLIRSSFPSEEEQCSIYCKLTQAVPGQVITFRTLDIGGDKMLAYFDHGTPVNPALGLRSIRFSLRHRDIFIQQIRAILRAGVGQENIRIMFPMISSLDELREAKAVVAECIAALVDEGIEHCSHPAIGMMVELPAVLGTIDAYAAEADFFSVGTNDFIQYMLAVDRGNAEMSQYYCAHHPSVLRGLARIAEAAVAQGKDVAVCGEMAHQRRYLAFLLGVGFDTFSVDPHYLPYMQETVATIDLQEAKAYAASLLAADTIAEADICLEQLP
ncbi:MAG: phosphoenolpyruvate--protein phosphotransferase [Kiritimatiellae bacterium]|nr:phosphoenolpyruvate--protein phosphotransferase [Kiritimatiellia bacterium]